MIYVEKSFCLSCRQLVILLLSFHWRQCRREQSRAKRIRFERDSITRPISLWWSFSLSLSLLHTINTRDELIIKPYLSLAYRAYCQFYTKPIFNYPTHFLIYLSEVSDKKIPAEGVVVPFPLFSSTRPVSKMKFRLVTDDFFLVFSYFDLRLYWIIVEAIWILRW